MDDDAVGRGVGHNVTLGRWGRLHWDGACFGAMSAVGA